MDDAGVARAYEEEYRRIVAAAEAQRERELEGLRRWYQQAAAEERLEIHRGLHRDWTIAGYTVDPAALHRWLSGDDLAEPLVEVQRESALRLHRELTDLLERLERDNRRWRRRHARRWRRQYRAEAQRGEGPARDGAIAERLAERLRLSEELDGRVHKELRQAIGTLGEAATMTGLRERMERSIRFYRRAGIQSSLNGFALASLGKLPVWDVASEAERQAVTKAAEAAKRAMAENGDRERLARVGEKLEAAWRALPAHPSPLRRRVANWLYSAWDELWDAAVRWMRA